MQLELLSIKILSDLPLPLLLFKDFESTSYISVCDLQASLLVKSETLSDSLYKVQELAISGMG